MSDTNKRKSILLSYLKKTLGIVTTACESAGVSRDTHYRWLREDAGYKKSVETIENIALDFAESKLFEQIKKGKPACIIFYLKTKGKKRGFAQFKKSV